MKMLTQKMHKIMKTDKHLLLYKFFIENIQTALVLMTEPQHQTWGMRVHRFFVQFLSEHRHYTGNIQKFTHFLDSNGVRWLLHEDPMLLPL